MLGAILIAAGIFGAGVVVGKRRARRHGGWGHGGCGWRRHGHGHHGHHGHHHEHGHHGHGWGFGGWGRRFSLLGRVFDELEVTPSQRAAIEDALRDLKGEVRGLRDTVFGSRRDVADALRGEDLDVDALGQTLAGGDEAVDRVRQAIAGFLGKLHTTLDAEQRRRLADLLERRWGRGPGWA